MKKTKILVGVLCATMSLCMLCACGNKDKIKIESWTEDISKDAIAPSSNTSSIVTDKNDTWFVDPNEYKNKDSYVETEEDEVEKDELEKDEINEDNITQDDENTKEEEHTDLSLESSIIVEEGTNLDNAQENLSTENDGEDTKSTITP